MRKLNQLENLSQLPDLALCQLNSWDLICVTGEDRVAFLQGQLTCDIPSLKPNDHCFAAQCDPQGKVWSIFIVVALEDRFLLLQPNSVTEQQLPALKKYAAFSKVEIEIETQYQAIGLSGAQSEQYIKALENSLVIKQPLPLSQYLIIADNKQSASIVNDLKTQATEFDDSLWNAMNIRSGVAFIEQQTTNQFIPQMLNLQALDGICFTKGCYIGQEVIARTKYRGINKRALFILSGEASCTPKVGNNIQLQLNDNWKRVGSIVASCQYNNGHVELLAILPTDSGHEGAYKVQEIKNSTLSIRSLPYSLDQA